jgi:hypothetical protein
MTDPTPWRAPGDPVSSAPAAPVAHPGATAGWTPPPRPGLFPLRPLDFGTIFSTVFRVLRRNPRPIFGVAVGLTALASFLTGAAVSIIALVATDRVARAAPADAEAIALGAGALIIISAVATGALSVVATAILQGIVAIEVASASLGERLSIRQIVARGRGRWGALIGWSLLLTAAVAVTLVALLALVVGMLALGDVNGLVWGLLLGIAGGLGMLVLGFWLWIKLVFVAPTLMLERRTLGRGIVRAWTLVRGRFWRTFGILLLLTFIVQTAAGVVTAPFNLGAIFAGTLVNPTGDATADLTVLIGTNLVAVALGAVVGAVGAVLTSAAATLLYVDARMRDEGLDLDLQRATEARASGTEANDPYRAS